MKRIFIVLAVVIIFFIGIFVSVRLSNPGIGAEIDDGCSDVLPEAIMGTWQYKGSLPEQPQIIIKNDGTFQFVSQNENLNIGSGNWVLNVKEKTLKLTFRDPSSTFAQVLKQDLSIYGSVHSYSFETQELTLRLKTTSTNTEMCSNDDTYVIDLFNVYYYKNI